MNAFSNKVCLFLFVCLCIFFICVFVCVFFVVCLFFAVCVCVGGVILKKYPKITVLNS